MSEMTETETTTISAESHPFGTITDVSCITYKCDTWSWGSQERRKRQRIAMRQNVDRKAKRKAQRRARRITRGRRGE